MKVIDLKSRTIFVDNIQQIYTDIYNGIETCNIQTIYGTYIVDKEDYFKVKDCLLSLNEKEKTLKEEKKIPEKLDLEDFEWKYVFDEQAQQDCIEKIFKKFNEIIDYLKSKGDE